MCDEADERPEYDRATQRLGESIKNTIRYHMTEYSMTMETIVGTLVMTAIEGAVAAIVDDSSWEDDDTDVVLESEDEDDAGLPKSHLERVIRSAAQQLRGLATNFYVAMGRPPVTCHLHPSVRLLLDADRPLGTSPASVWGALQFIEVPRMESQPVNGAYVFVLA